MVLNATFSTTTPIINTMAPVITEGICIQMLYYGFEHSNVTYWDLSLLIPSILFTIFLIINFRKIVVRLNTTSSPVMTTFFVQVCIVDVAMVVRAIVAMVTDDKIYFEALMDIVLWLVLRFFLLSMEMSILVFAIGSGHLDSRSSVHRVLTITSCVAFSYSLSQFILELYRHDTKFHTLAKNYDVFGHGGVMFLAITSSLFALVYLIVLILPLTPLRSRWALPTKTSFYIYCFVLTVHYTIQSVTSFIFFFGIIEGLCFINVTTFIYFTCFGPFVYFAFLSAFFSTRTGRLAFLYRRHYDIQTPSSHVPPVSTLTSTHPPGLVRGSSSELIFDDAHLQASTHFTLAASNLGPDYQLTDSCNVSVDPDCDYFSGQSHGKHSSSHRRGATSQQPRPAPCPDYGFRPRFNPARLFSNPADQSSGKFDSTQDSLS